MIITNDKLIIALINTGIIIISIIIFGLLISLIQKIIGNIIASIFGANAANVFLNKITFIGVMHHELSHATLALLTGAKICKISLFKPDEKTGTLGKVEYAARGPILWRGIQHTLTSIAPVICGTISCILIIKLLVVSSIWKTIIASFILLCIIIHMNLSTQDIKIALRGLPACFIIMFSIFYITNFNVL